MDLADANEQRDWRIYADLGQDPLRQTCGLYPHAPLRLELDQVVCALVAIVRKPVKSEASLFETFQVLSVSVFDSPRGDAVC